METKKEKSKGLTSEDIKRIVNELREQGSDINFSNESGSMIFFFPGKPIILKNDMDDKEDLEDKEGEDKEE